MIGVGTFRTSERARKYVNQVLDSERLSYGPFMQKFEADFAAVHGCRFGVMTNSGTCCLMIALAALKSKYGWQDGDEVIVPAVTFIATSNIVIQLNMKPVFVDVEADYYGIDPTKIEAAITPKTRCIIPVHLFGLPCDMDPIAAIAKKHNLRLIEDSCETMFASYKGRSVGSLSDIGCFSTYVAHLLVTGVGGLCTTNDAELAVIMRSIMNHGRDNIYISIDDDKNKNTEEKKMIISRRFRFVQMGYSFRATELEGALGLAGLEEKDAMMVKRRAHGQYLSRALAPLSDHLQVPAIRPGCDHSFMMFPVVLKKEKKTRFVNFLENNGIETRDMLPLINQPFYAELFHIREGDFPVADWINDCGFYIACHQDLTEEQLKYIVSMFFAYFEQRTIDSWNSSLIVMSRLAASDFDEKRVKNYLEALPLSEFSELLLADGTDGADGTDEADGADGSGNERLRRYFAEFGFRTVDSKNAAGRSKGDLLNAAVNAATCENIVVIGMDGTDNPADIDNILIRLKSGSEMVIASRFVAGGKRAHKGFITQRSFGNRFFAFLTGLCFGQNVTDTNNLFRGFKRSLFRQLGLENAGDEIMFAATVRGLAGGLTIDEFPTKERAASFAIAKRSRFVSALSFFRILIEALSSKPVLKRTPAESGVEEPLSGGSAQIH
jgi:CDP-6-deoxy-D-xylo-4-hexulose-3-dehydrase